MAKLAALTRKLNYKFNDRNLLLLALTHRSRGAKNYERLEFLGDSILGFVIAEWLYKEFPGLAEGKLSRMRSSLVRKETLAEVARVLQLGDYLILGEGEMKSGGFNRDSILADTVESLIGAIYLDSDFQHASQFIFANFESQLSSISSKTNFKDAKSQLQEAMQKRGLDLPAYEIINSTGEQHEQEISVECTLPSLSLKAQATARSRRTAEQQAATRVLAILSEAAAQTKARR
ncbi:MAG: ribonuclease III [Pseudomonadota bacterium]